MCACDHRVLSVHMCNRLHLQATSNELGMRFADDSDVSSVNSDDAMDLDDDDVSITSDMDEEAGTYRVRFTYTDMMSLA